MAEWLQALKVQTREDGRRLYVNAAQYEAVAKVAKKVQEELPNRVGAAPAPSDPLRWVVHGGPGTGKSHVVRDVINDIKPCPKPCKSAQIWSSRKQLG